MSRTECSASLTALLRTLVEKRVATLASPPPLLKLYGVTTVVGDRYAGEWPREQFRKLGIAYQVADRAKSDLYRDLLPRLNSATLELLDSPRLLAQLGGLERRTARGGRDSIDHGPGGHDDVANAAAGALLGASAPAPTLQIYSPPGRLPAERVAGWRPITDVAEAFGRGE